MLRLLKYNPVASAVAAILLAVVVRFFVQGYRIRKLLHNAPGPPHSWIWGHLLIMGNPIRSGEVPLKVHPQVILLLSQKKYNCEPTFYLDLWPFAPTMLCCSDPLVAAKFTTEYSAPKHPEVARSLKILAGGPGDMLSSSGPHWKKWRAIFNPGFAAQHLMSLVPGIVDDCVRFADKMTEYAKTGNPFRMEDDAIRLTLDVISQVAINQRLDCQRENNKTGNMVAAAMRDQMECMHMLSSTNLDPLARYYPRGVYRRWRNNRILDNWIGKVLDDRFEETAQELEVELGSGEKHQRRAIIDLALLSYCSQDSKAKATASQRKTLDPDFRRNAITQIRIFLFAGHDTTSAAICYALYLLNKNPETLSRIRAEHDAILGPAVDTPELLRKAPRLLSKLPYTTAAIKETLRLNPATSTYRAADANTHLTDPKTGEPLILPEGIILCLNHWSIHRDPVIWGPTAATFDPSRFLPENSSTLPEACWRPFERGIKNCIGQDLAMIEAQIALALVVRSFDFVAAYDAVDQLAGDRSVYGRDGEYRRGRMDLDGEEAWPILLGTARPREGMPMRVREV